jgi:hypothetical protein
MSVSDPGSVFAQAKQVLIETPEAFAEGLALLRRAADMGSGEATAKLAHITALGVDDKPDWDRSVDLLRHAAELGWAPAQAELELLAGAQARIDIRAFVAPRPTEQVSLSPRIRTLAGFMSPSECAWIVAHGSPRLERATVYNRVHGDVRVVDERSNSVAGFPVFHVTLALILLQQRIANSIGVPKEWLEIPALMHYRVGQQFLPHVDYLEPSVPSMAEELQRQGQRIATFLVYLNDDFEGGHTDFPRLNYRFKGRTGDALVFANVDLERGPDPRTLHAGLPPTKGEKWLFSQWVRDRAVE